MTTIAFVLYVGIGALALSFPAFAILFGILIGARFERRAVVRYLRSLEDDNGPTFVKPWFVATRIEARAHRGLDVRSIDDLVTESKERKGRR